MGSLLSDFFGERRDKDGRIQKIRGGVAELAEQAEGWEEPLSPNLRIGA